MLGHWRPLFLGFAKGGKMVATCGGVFFGVAVWVALTAGVVWLTVFLIFRYASLASIVAGHLAAGVRRTSTAIRRRSSVRRRRRVPRSSSCIARTSRACAAGTESRFHFRRAANA